MREVGPYYKVRSIMRETVQTEREGNDLICTLPLDLTVMILIYR